jgi:hypothetical protein
MPNGFNYPGTIFNGTPIGPVTTFNFAESFGIRGDSAPVINMALQGIVPSLFGSSGQYFAQMNPQMNLYEQMRRRSAFEMQQASMREAASVDKRTYQGLFTGFANIAGTPVGFREQQAINVMANDMASIMPMLASAAPDLMDRLHGTRGSAIVMAQRMAQTAQMMADPLSGQLGMSQASLSAINKNVFNSLFGEGADISQMRGVTAGQAGAMYDEMARRGMVSTAPRSLSEIARESLAKQMGPQQPNALGKTVDELMNMPDFDDKMRQFESSRITDRLKSMAGAVSAMKDIFGENGQPDAPMSQIFNALQQLTQNNLSNMNGADVEKMVRGAAVSARMTGMGIQNMMAAVAAAGSLTDRHGLNRQFATGVASDASVFAQAFANQTGNTRAFGLIDKEKMLQLDMQTRAAALGSSEANAQAALLRMIDTGALPRNQNTESLYKYAEDLKAGRNAKMITASEIGGMIKAGGGNDTDFYIMAGQKVANQPYLANVRSIGTMVAEQGQRLDALMIIQNSMGDSVTSDIGLKLGKAFSVADGQKVKAFLSSRMLNLSSEEKEKVSNGDTNFLAEELRAAVPHLNLSAEDSKLMLSKGYGSLAGYTVANGYPDPMTFLAKHSTDVLTMSRLSRAVRDDEAAMQSKMSTMARSDMTQKVMDMLINAKGDETLSDFMSKAFGAESLSKIDEIKASGLTPEKLKAMQKLNNRSVQGDAVVLRRLFENKAGKENADVMAIASAYGLTGDQIEAIKADSLTKGIDSERAIILGLSAAASKAKMSNLNNIDTGIMNKIMGVAQGLPDGAIATLLRSIKNNSGDIAQNAAALQQQFTMSPGARSMFSGDSGMLLLSNIDKLGKVTGLDPSDFDPNKVLGDKTIANSLTARLNTMNAAESSVQKLKEQHGYSSVEEMAGDLSYTAVLDDAGKAELNRLLQNKSSAKPGPEREAADRALRAHASKYGYNLRSATDSSFKTKLTDAQGKIVSKAMSDRLKSATELSNTVDMISKESDFTLAGIMGGKGQAEAIVAGAKTGIKILGEHLRYVNSVGGVVMDEGAIGKIRTEVEDRNRIAQSPGDALLSLVGSIAGDGTTAVTKDVAEAIDKTGDLSLRQFLSGQVFNLEKFLVDKDGKALSKADKAARLKSLGQAKGASEADKQNILSKLFGSSKGGRAEFDLIDTSLLEDINQGKSMNMDNMLKQAKKAEEDDKAKKATTVTLAKGTSFNGVLDLSTGGMSMVVDEGPKK